MKKLICISIPFIITGIYFTSCKKSVEQNVQHDNKNYSIKSQDKNAKNAPFDSEFQIGNEGRFLVFKNISGYEKAVDNPSSEIRQNLFARLNTINHKSWEDYYLNDNDISNDTLIDDGYFSKILSKDRTLQIENHIYLVKPETHEVIALHISKKNLYPELIGENTNNPNFIHFNIQDDVLDLIKKSNPGEIGIGNGPDNDQTKSCSEDCAGGNGQRIYTNSIGPSELNGINSFKISGYVRYIKLGLYFYLHAHAESNHTNNGIRIYIQGENFQYKEKCRTKIAPISFPWYQNNKAESKNQNYYLGSRRCFYGYYMKMRVRCEIDGFPQGSNPYTTFFTNWVEHSRNYPF
jgi:hypothetical protein